MKRFSGGFITASHFGLLAGPQDLAARQSGNTSSLQRSQSKPHGGARDHANSIRLSITCEGDGKKDAITHTSYSKRSRPSDIKGGVDGETPGAPHRLSEDFDRWLEEARDSGFAPFQRLAKTLAADRAAVLAAIELEWSTGQVEGHINRVKLMKRLGYGRAGFPLLRARILGIPFEQDHNVASTQGGDRLALTRDCPTSGGLCAPFA